MAARKKVTIVGAGNVGSTTALRLADRDYADIVLVDVVEGLPQGKALDLLEAGPIRGVDTRLIGVEDYEATAGSDLVIVTSGMARRPGMSRDDLVAQNAGIILTVVEQVARYSPDTILLMVSNPLDAMVHLAYRASGFPKNRVLGMAGVLDAARFRTFIALELNVSVEDVQGFVLGGHADSMVPLARYTTVAGIPITELLSAHRIEALCKRTAAGGTEIVDLLKTGSAFYAPGTAVAEMADAILLDKKRIVPATVYLQGEYGIDDLFIGVPVKLGAMGVEQIIEIKLTSDEDRALKRSAGMVRELVDTMFSRVNVDGKRGDH
ncbi:MAG: malate dehydrogenase [Chloroflexota bacterium]|nr:malate dehydrogenase [Chloroflexota bacterium]